MNNGMMLINVRLSRRCGDRHGATIAIPSGCLVSVYANDPSLIHSPCSFRCLSRNEARLGSSRILPGSARHTSKAPSVTSPLGTIEYVETARFSGFSLKLLSRPSFPIICRTKRFGRDTRNWSDGWGWFWNNVGQSQSPSAAQRRLVCSDCFAFDERVLSHSHTRDLSETLDSPLSAVGSFFLRTRKQRPLRLISERGLKSRAQRRWLETFFVSADASVAMNVVCGVRESRR